MRQKQRTTWRRFKKTRELFMNNLPDDKTTILDDEIAALNDGATALNDEFFTGEKPTERQLKKSKFSKAADKIKLDDARTKIEGVKNKKFSELLTSAACYFLLALITAGFILDIVCAFAFGYKNWVGVSVAHVAALLIVGMIFIAGARRKDAKIIYVVDDAIVFENEFYNNAKPEGKPKKYYVVPLSLLKEILATGIRVRKNKKTATFIFSFDVPDLTYTVRVDLEEFLISLNSLGLEIGQKIIFDTPALARRRLSETKNGIYDMTKRGKIGMFFLGLFVSGIGIAFVCLRNFLFSEQPVMGIIAGIVFIMFSVFPFSTALAAVFVFDVGLIWGGVGSLLFLGIGFVAPALILSGAASAAGGAIGIFEAIGATPFVGLLLMFGYIGVLMSVAVIFEITEKLIARI
jgi:hypothetical protein